MRFEVKAKSLFDALEIVKAYLKRKKLKAVIVMIKESKGVYTLESI